LLGAFFCCTHKYVGSRAQTGGEIGECAERGGFETPFDLADIGAMQAASAGQFFLRDAQQVSLASDFKAERYLQIGA
jgi:hypothetical protein